MLEITLRLLLLLFLTSASALCGKEFATKTLHMFAAARGGRKGRCSAAGSFL